MQMFLIRMGRPHASIINRIISTFPGATLARPSPRSSPSPPATFLLSSVVTLVPVWTYSRGVITGRTAMMDQMRITAAC